MFSVYQKWPIRHLVNINHILSKKTKAIFSLVYVQQRCDYAKFLQFLRPLNWLSPSLSAKQNCSCILSYS